MAATLEERVAALEAEVERLRGRETKEELNTETPWWEKVRGAFKDDPVYDEINRLGAEYRRAQPIADDEQDAEDSAHVPV